VHRFDHGRDAHRDLRSEAVLQRFGHAASEQRLLATCYEGSGALAFHESPTDS
jgi:hypothetical protein